MSKSGKRRSLRAGLLAGAVVVALGVGGVSAGSASATPTCASGGSPIVATGSSLQNRAHNEATVGWSKVWNAACPSQTVTYESTSSGEGFKAWHFSGTEAFKVSKAFIGSDDGPNTSQIASAIAGTKTGEEAEGSNVVVVPVAQTSIGVVVNPPNGCGIEEITNQQLENVFNGTITKWNKLTGLYDIGLEEGEAATCLTPGNITRVVRSGGSGTTFQFKAYLSQINPTGILACSGGKKWNELEEVGTNEEPNKNWPGDATLKCGGGEGPLSPVQPSTENKGGALVQTVNGKEGSIGYAALPDIEFNKTGDTHWVQVQNNGKAGNASYAKPGFAATKSANCGSAKYAVPLTAQTGGANADWSAVFGANYNIATSSGNTEAYPICTLTYDVSLDNYSGVKVKNGASEETFTEAAEKTAKSYLTYVTSKEGQERLQTAKTYYAELPTSKKAAQDVQGAARLAAAKIGW
jgi:ABC-type phosphate transport system substrate-binding protein